MRKILVAALFAVLPLVAQAQTLVTAPNYRTTIGGNAAQPAFGVFCLNLDGTSCSFGSSSSGGGTGGTVTQGTGSTASPWPVFPGQYNTTSPTFTNAQVGYVQLDVNGRQITVGAGTAGAPAGGVMSIQGVAGGTPQSVSNSGTFPVQNNAATPAGTNSIGSVGLNAGSNTIGSIANTAFGVTSLPSLPAGANNIGTVGVNPATGSMEQDVRLSQSLNVATVGNQLTFALNGQSTIAFTFTGLTASGATLSYYQSNDGGTTYTPVGEVNTGNGQPSLTRTTDGQTGINAAGHTHIRVQVTTAGTGSVTIASNISVRPRYVALSAPLLPGENRIGSVGGTTRRVFSSFTRPANTTTYVSGQLVANSTTAASVTPITLAAARITGGTGAITAFKLSKTSTTTANAVFRVHLYRNSPTASNGDGAAWLTTSSLYLGYADITMDRVFTDEVSGTGIPKDTAGNQRNLLFDTAAGSQNLYALIEARSAYAPASGETFTLTAEVLQD